MGIIKYCSNCAALEQALAERTAERNKLDSRVRILSADLAQAQGTIENAICVLQAKFHQLRPGETLPLAGSRGGQLAQNVESVLGEIGRT